MIEAYWRYDHTYPEPNEVLYEAGSVQPYDGLGDTRRHEQY